jgi:tRNA (guanine-N7-)-methyltransferase
LSKPTTDGMTRLPPVDLRPYFLTFHDLGGSIDWKALFGNEHPVALDVGCGRGLFLLSAAEANPGINYLGIELDYKEGRRAARRLHKRSLPNARVLGGDARIALSQLVPRESVSAVHVYFPDPWWKRKHKRRRLFTDEFVDLAAAVLKSGAALHSWTDVEDYFQVIRALMDNHARFEALPPPAERQPEHDLDYQTSFERKKRQLGARIFRGRWRKRERAVL